jgi:hypothetical protein
MQNSLFSIKDKSLLQNNKLVKKLAETWKESEETMGEIMSIVIQTSNASVKAFEEMRILREDLLANNATLIRTQKSLLSQMKEFRLQKEILQNVANEVQANKDFVLEKEITVITMARQSYYSTLCTQHGDVKVCHKKCGLGYEPQLNLAHFVKCAAADGMNCRHCKCGMNKHLHSYTIPVETKKTIHEIIAEKQKAFTSATKDMQDSCKKMAELDETIEQSQKEVDEIKTKLLTTIRDLKKTCTHFNFSEEMKTTIDNLRKEAKIETDMPSKRELNNTADAIEQLLRQLG